MQTLDEFTRAYVECLLWAETDNATEQGGEPLDRNYGAEDFAPEALQTILDDCQRFQNENRADLDQYPDHNGYTGAELAGHNFWLTRNGHGTGFWDREYLPEDLRDRLTSAAQGAGEVWVYVGDDGRLYL